MKATIKVTGYGNTTEDEAKTFEAVYEKEWESENKLLAEYLNIFCSMDQLPAGYNPNPVQALAVWSVELLRSKGFQAEFVSADQIDYSQHPEDAVY